ncbi:TraR/DksA C4-type zinc finger protein [Neobacillus sedimentimangrovi]|jgi:YteA family regulatory protein|uniref:TraR/DksA C4-type zinc finger protein n=1 Tax=Neobacillus sedimentimangrovi TaxID=2699460 RepID=A0ABS8QIH7_9BACI|nr:TraR/DksA C4-type zinc finger protein [Neobacillus sedimentimangrovi]MCD4838938.1 TraR/DksA C4-type zinc finger protein [Neobacillus sedimentimangrovi]
MLSTEQLANLRLRLLKEKEELEENLNQNDHFGFERGHYHESMGELSSYDNHPADEGTDLYEREKDNALLEHYKIQLGNINKALQTMENGTYGKCEVCGKDIPVERLEALPNTTYCIEHSQDQMTSHNRPVEEGVLMPPFGKFDMDEKDENVAFDAEDAWQVVSQWGTSETPSDFAFRKEHYNDVSNEAEENEGYVEDFENFVGNDIHGKNITVYPTPQHEQYENALDEEGIMTSFGDLPAFERDPYVEDDR